MTQTQNREAIADPDSPKLYDRDFALWLAATLKRV